MIEFGCKFSGEIILWAFLGSLTALITCQQKVIWQLFNDIQCCKPVVVLQLLFMLFAGTVMGCVIDCSNRNTFFGGFFGYSICTMLGDQGLSAVKKFLGGKNGFGRS